MAGNIKQGVDIFGVNGTVIQATGNATAGDVLTGKTFSNATAAGIACTMPNNGAVTITPGTSDQAIAAGYNNGSGKVQGDVDLVAGNIKQGVNLFGVDGTLTSGGGGAGVPKTGQTTSYATGDDGDLQKGVAWPNPRFTDNSNGTATDNLTGLIWLKNANCANATRIWATALSDVASLNSAGTMNSNNCGDTSKSGSHQTDWRLPNVREMQSLVDYGRSDLALPSGHPFTAIQSYYYWSSTTYANGTGSAWYVYLGDGYVYYDDKTYSVYVWPVRGGQ